MQIKVVDNRTSLSRKLKELSEQVEGLAEEVGRQTIQSLVAESPVDTGAFMDSYNASDGRSRGGGVSSDGKPRRQSWETHAAAAISRVYSQLTGSSTMIISNNAPHAGIVEKKYMPFAKTRARRKVIVDRAVARVFSR